MQSKAQIDEILRQKSDSKEIPGVVAIAADYNVTIAAAAGQNVALGTAVDIVCAGIACD